MPTRSYITVYRWKAYDPIDRHGWLVLASVTSAIERYVVKVGLFVLLAIFVSKNAYFPRFFEKLVPQNNYFFVNANPFITITRQLLYETRIQW